MKLFGSWTLATLLLQSFTANAQRIRGGPPQQHHHQKSNAVDVEARNRLLDEKIREHRQRQRKLSHDSGTGEEEFSPSPAPAPGSTAPPVAAGGSSTREKSEIELMLAEYYAVWGGIEFYDEATYWMKALRYVENTATDGMEDWRLGQRYALACIYYATNGISTNYTDDLFGDSLNGQVFDWMDKWADGTDEVNECEWWGVVCEDDGVNDYGKVLELNLAANWLTGSFPGEVYILKDTLEVLDLEFNLCWNVGRGGLWWLERLVNLRILSLGKIGFDSEGAGLPSELAALTKLERLDVYSTLFLGPLDEDILEAMTSLKYIDIGALDFKGSPVPDSLKDLPDLKYIYLDDSGFAGDLASFLDGTGFGDLEELWLDNNVGITGVLPGSISAYTTLSSLSVANCGLSGPLPASLGLLVALEQLWLYGNAFSGGVPAELANLPMLYILQLHANNLSGVMPTQVCGKRNGILGDLTSDCEAPTPEVTCTCCTCCGETCA